MRRAVALMLLLSACGSKPPNQPASDAAPGTRITVNDDNGATTTGVIGARWPESAPAHVPPYPGATVNSAMSGMNAGSGGASDSGMLISFTTPDDDAAVADFYMTRAKAAGLRNTSTIDAGGQRMMTANDAATGRSVTVTTTVEGGTTTVGLLVGGTGGG